MATASPDTPIRWEVWLPNLFALKEVKRGAEKVVRELTKLKKKMEDEGLPTHDLREALGIWEGEGDFDGVMAQLDEQLAVFVPRPAAPPTGEQGDVFAQAPVHNDPNPRIPAAAIETDVEPLSVEALRDLLAERGVYVPAAVIDTWPRAWRSEAQAWMNDMDEPGTGALWLASWPLPEGYARDDEGDVWDTRGEPEKVLLTSEVESLALAEIEDQEAAAREGAHSEQPWIVVDLERGEGVDRYQVMHRVTRERRLVPADAVGESLSTADASEEDAARAAAESLAMRLSATEPEGEPLPVVEALDEAVVEAVAGDVEAGARALRRKLYTLGELVPLAAVLAWTPEQRMEADDWVEGELGEVPDGAAVPQHVAAAHVQDLEDTLWHPDADFVEELLAESVEEGEPSVATADNPAESEDIPAPAPAQVVSLLKKARHVVPLVLAERMTDEGREQAAAYATALLNGEQPEAVPACIASITWERRKGEHVAVSIAGSPVPVAPEPPFNFVLAGNRKPVRVLDVDSGKHYGDNWSQAEAEAVLAAWNNGESATVRGASLPVRGEGVLLDQ